MALKFSDIASLLHKIALLSDSASEVSYDVNQRCTFQVWRYELQKTAAAVTNAMLCIAKEIAALPAILSR